MQDIPNFHYFYSGNSFSGSAGKLRYRLQPAEDGLCAVAWFGSNCLEKTEESDIRQQNFSADEKGLAEAIQWLDRIKDGQE
ncbi:MAG: hypothetical protein ACOX6P_02445 [Candidatus Merdivicinus sp.]